MFFRKGELRRGKALKLIFFICTLKFLTTVLNLFQTSESVFQDVANVRKYNFQMEAQPDLVNLNQFVICIRALKIAINKSALCLFYKVRLLLNMLIQLYEYMKLK